MHPSCIACSSAYLSRFISLKNYYTLNKKRNATIIFSTFWIKNYANLYNTVFSTCFIDIRHPNARMQETNCHSDLYCPSYSWLSNNMLKGVKHANIISWKISRLKMCTCTVCLFFTCNFFHRFNCQKCIIGFQS